MVVASSLVGCADDEPTGPQPSGSGGDGGESGAVSWPNLGCDPLVPSYCGYPFPSNVYSVADPGTPTGRRLRLLPEIMPIGSNQGVSLPDPVNRADGFSSSAALLAHFPGATLEGVAGPDQIEEQRLVHVRTVPPPTVQRRQVCLSLPR